MSDRLSTSSVGVNRPAIVREIPHVVLLTPFLRECLAFFVWSRKKNYLKIVIIFSASNTILCAEVVREHTWLAPTMVATSGSQIINPDPEIKRRIAPFCSGSLYDEVMW